VIESLHIEDLGVIEEADLPLSRGLTALTGETGAGKTMVLTSLGLLLGQRAETTIVRTGAERSLVEGAFLVDPDSQKPDAALTAAVAQAARSRGLILLTCGTYGNVIRLLPPVTMPDELFAEGMEILEQALRDQP